jgi:hypothetical protein
MSARATKKVNKLNNKPAKRAAAKDHPKRPTKPSKSPSSTAKKATKAVSRGSSSGKAAKPVPAPARKSGAAKSVPPKSAGKLKKRPQKPSSSPQSKQVDTRAALQKARAQEKKAQEKAKRAEQQLRAREAQQKAEQKRKLAEQKRRDAERLEAQKRKQSELKRKEAERRTAQKLKEAEAKRKEQERLRAAQELQKKREAEQKVREAEKARILAEKAAAKEAQRKAAEDERVQRQQEREAAKVAKEQERAQLKAARDAEREEARRLKEEERAKREAEREAYRKAKEAEREKIRAAKEAARRALEGRIAEATRNANKLGGGRSSTTRIYSPRAIPDQSGTTRRLQTPTPISSPPSPDSAEPIVEVESVPPTEPIAEVSVTSEPTSKPPEGGAPVAPTLTADEEAARAADRSPPIPENVEDRYRVIEERLKAAPDGFNRDYKETIDMSWIHHDSALEGVVYTFQELKTAIDPSTSAVTDSSLQPVIDEIRRHKQAIDLVRDLGERKRAPITVDTIKKIYVTLHPEEGDIKTVKYRRDIPQHRLYFHEYAHPEKITYKVRQVVDWLNGPEPKKLKSPIRVAARVHYELLRVFPFQTDSGKVARLVMNLILMRAGHPPAIIHSTERQRYYEALKGALPVLVQMVTESIMNALASIEKLLDDHDIRLKA